MTDIGFPLPPMGWGEKEKGEGGERRRGPTLCGARFLSGVLLWLFAVSRAWGQACISATTFVTPGVVSECQVVSVVVDIMNCGTSDLENVAPCDSLVTGCPVPDCLAVAPSLSASVWKLSGPVPTCTAYLTPGDHALYTWQFRAVAGGTGEKVDFTATVTGKEAGGPGTVTTSDTGTLSIPAFDPKFCATVFINSGVGSGGGTITVVADVMNCGSACLTEVTPCDSLGIGCPVPDCLQVAPFASSSLLKVSGPTPSCTVFLAPGEHVFYTWQFTASATGQVDFTLTMTGKDVMGSVTQAPDTGTVIIRTGICVTVFVDPAVVSEGQAMSVRVEAMNCGMVDLKNVAPIPDCDSIAIAMTPASPASVLLDSGPAPSCPVYLTPGQSASYIWQFQTVAMSRTFGGTVDFTVTVTGEEIFRTVDFTITVTGTGVLSIQKPAQLEATLRSEPVGMVKFKQSVTIYLDVTNVGGADADFAKALSQTITGSGDLSLQPCPLLATLCPPDPSKQLTTIPGGETKTFTWLYQAITPGIVTITSAALGTDHNLNLPTNVSSTTMTLTIKAPSTLSLTVTGPDQAVQGQEFDLKVVVANFSTTLVCQSDFVVRLSGASDCCAPDPSSSATCPPPEGLGCTVELKDLADSLLPQCYEPSQVREFTLRVRLIDVPPQAAQLTVQAVGTEQLSCLNLSNAPCSAGVVPIASVGGSVPFQVRRDVSQLEDIDRNPYRPRLHGEVKITYVIAPAQAGRPASIRVYTVGGELVKTLVDATLPAGVYDAVWDGKNTDLELVASGVYLVLFKAHASKHLRKLTVIR